MGCPAGYSAESIDQAIEQCPVVAQIESDSGRTAVEGLFAAMEAGKQLQDNAPNKQPDKEKEQLLKPEHEPENESATNAAVTAGIVASEAEDQVAPKPPLSQQLEATTVDSQPKEEQASTKVGSPQVEAESSTVLDVATEEVTNVDSQPEEEQTSAQVEVESSTGLDIATEEDAKDLAALSSGDLSAHDDVKSEQQATVEAEVYEVPPTSAAENNFGAADTLSYSVLEREHTPLSNHQDGSEESVEDYQPSDDGATEEELEDQARLNQAQSSESDGHEDVLNVETGLLDESDVSGIETEESYAHDKTEVIYEAETVADEEMFEQPTEEEDYQQAVAVELYFPEAIFETEEQPSTIEIVVMADSEWSELWNDYEQDESPNQDELPNQDGADIQASDNIEHETGPSSIEYKAATLLEGIAEVESTSGQDIETNEQYVEGFNAKSLEVNAELTVVEWPEIKAQEPEQVETLEAICDRADNQSIEQTIYDYALFYLQNPEDRGQIMRLAARLYEHSQGAEQKKDEDSLPKLNTESAKELIVLLNMLGYESPQESALAFIRQHGEEGLFRLMQSLLMLTQPHYRYEFIARNKTFTKPTDDQQLASLQVGRLAVELLGLKARLSV